MPYGTPRTEEERSARHAMIHGAETTMPATRMGRGVNAGKRPLPEYPNETLSYAEDGRITNVSFPASAKKGSEITVSTTVKNTGTKTAEFRVYLKNSAGTTIDKEPDTYRSVKPGQSSVIKTSTHWDPRWAMPGYDWNNLRVELWEIDWGRLTKRHDARVFSIKLDAATATENGKITNVAAPKSAKKGSEITVSTTVKNTGTKTAEFRVYLKNSAGTTIDKEPDTYRSVKPGQSSVIKTSTHWNPRWAMPGSDWNNLRVELWEIDLFGGNDRLDARVFSIKLDTGAAAENGRIINVVAPKSAKKGAEITVSTTVENTGTKTCEFRVYLKNAAGTTIDKEPDTYRSVKPGQKTTIETSTHWDPRWAMPGHDLNNMKVELWEIDLFGGNDKLDDRVFSIRRETLADIVPGLATPLSVTVENAAIGYATGTRYELKFWLPVLNLLPGVPYTPGMWIPWGYIITEV